MPSYQLHLASIAGVDDGPSLIAAVKEYAAGQTAVVDNYVVLSVDGGERAVTMDLAYCTAKKITILRPSSGDKSTSKSPDLGMDVGQVGVAVPLTIAICTSAGRLKTCGPGVRSLEMANEFLAGALAWPVLSNPIAVDIEKAIDHLVANTERTMIRAASVSDYSHNSYMIGGYAPKFLDSQHGLDFAHEYIEAMTSVSVQFAGPTGKVSVKLTGSASFSFSCQEDDRPYVEGMLTKLAGWKS